MRDFARRAAAAAVGVIAFGCAGVAAAADFGVPAAPAPAPQYYGEQQYQEYEEPLVQPGYVVPPAPVYPYAAPVYRYGYVPPVAVVPPPYYRPYRYGYRYGYAGRGYGPYAGRGYGVYGGRGYGAYAGRGYGTYGGYRGGHGHYR